MWLQQMFVLRLHQCNITATYCNKTKVGNVAVCCMFLFAAVKIKENAAIACNINKCCGTVDGCSRYVLANSATQCDNVASVQTPKINMKHISFNIPKHKSCCMLHWWKYSFMSHAWLHILFYCMVHSCKHCHKLWQKFL